MHRVQSIKEIWDEVNCKGSKLPHIVKIRFTNVLTHRTGSLWIFDLLQPKFLHSRGYIGPVNAVNNNSGGITADTNINNSFQKLRT